MLKGCSFQRRAAPAGGFHISRFDGFHVCVRARVCETLGITVNLLIRYL